MIFKSRKDILFNVIVFGMSAIIAGATISMFLNGKMEIYRYGISILIFGLVAFWLWTFLGTEYELTETEFIFRSGPFAKKIQIDRINEIVRERTLWIGNWPATARKGLLIKYDTYGLINISPKTNESFIEKIMELNKNIKITR